MPLPLYLLACLGYAAYAVGLILREKSDPATAGSARLRLASKFLFGGGIPLGVAGTMAYLFLIAGGATTVQFNVGSSSRMNAWSNWVDLFPLFLLLTAASGLGTLIWLIVAAIRKSMRPEIPVAIASLLLSVLAFITVASHYPSA